jgi:hypothetical protein
MDGVGIHLVTCLGKVGIAIAVAMEVDLLPRISLSLV